MRDSTGPDAECRLLGRKAAGLKTPKSRRGTVADRFLKADLPKPSTTPYSATMMAQRELWKHLAERLGTVAIAPFELVIGGEKATFAALLPQFGGQAGMIVDPEWETIEPYTDALVEMGFGYSAVTLDETVDEEAAREMLRDWGWSASAARPDWLEVPARG